MKKAVYNNTGSRQIVNTGFKTFDKQTNCISTGNVYANTQISSFIRPWSETECNGFTSPCGKLMNFDLRQFSSFRMPYYIREKIEDTERTESVILYLFFIRRDHKIQPLCWVLTDKNKHLITESVFNWTQKRENAMFEIIKYITNDEKV